VLKQQNKFRGRATLILPTCFVSYKGVSKHVLFIAKRNMFRNMFRFYAYKNESSKIVSKHVSFLCL
jgi:hypothetical protein